MTIIAYIGRCINEKEQLNRFKDDYARDSFNSNFFLLYGGPNIFTHLRTSMRNSFYTQGTKVLVLHLYSKIQRVLMAMKTLVRIWRKRRATIASVETDLFMNSLNNFPNYQKIKLLQKGTIYEFRLTDIMKLWLTALCNSSSFSPNPILPKNPFTNIPFDQGHLATCYVKLRRTDFIIPPLITIFWNCSMDLERFREEAYPQLKEEAVRNYMDKSSNEIMFYDIVAMISSLARHLNHRSVSMDLSDRHKLEFIYDMKPFLYEFLLSQHCCNPVRKRRVRKEMLRKLKLFFIKNPLSGRRVVFPAWRSRRQESNNFSFMTNSVLGDSVFIFGARREEEESAASGDAAPDANVVVGSSPIEDPGAAPTDMDEDESYNEVLDDSGDETDIQEEEIRESELFTGEGESGDDEDDADEL